MADKKITELPLSGALDGTEIVPIVQGGITSQATTQDIADLGGGTQNLQSVTDAGNTTTNDIQFDAGVGVLLDNTSRLREGTIDAGYGGNKGIAQICAVGYELKWESGSLYVMNGDGTQIRYSLYNFASIPGATEDISKGFTVGSRWSLDNGDVYVCTDNTITAAVWVLQTIVVPTKTSDLINDGDDGVSHFISLNDLPSNLILYATNKASDIPTYVKLVSSITDIDYNTTAVDVSTGAITTTNQFISALATSANVIVGNPGVLNITTIGNIRRTSGTGNAVFYFEVWKRRSSGAESLITTSGSTLPVFNGVYSEFSATALWNDGIFIATDRIVLKFYGSRVAGGSNPTYDFQFGGSTPVRSLVPIPLTVSPTPLSELVINKSDSYTASSSTTYSSTKALVDGLATKGNSTLDTLVFSGSYMPHSLGYTTSTTTAGINGYMISQKISGRKTCTITSLSAYCNTGVAGGNIRIAIYSDLNGLPNTLIAGTDTGNISCATTGLKEGAITPYTLVSGTVYHVVIQVSSGTISLRYNSNQEKAYWSPLTSNYVFSILASSTYIAFSATFPTITFYYDNATFNTCIYLKAQ
jgi:hypothetical protein